MRLVRGIVNAVLMATLIKPIVRLTVSRWRRRARESAAATVGIPVQELLEAALIEELAGAAAEASPIEEVLEEPAGRGRMRSMLLAAAALALIAGVSVAAARLIRRRREAKAAEEPEWVAIPVDASEAAAREAEEVVAEEALID